MSVIWQGLVAFHRRLERRIGRPAAVAVIVAAAVALVGAVIVDRRTALPLALLAGVGLGSLLVPSGPSGGRARRITGLAAGALLAWALLLLVAP